MIEPSALKLTDHPDWSKAASPSISSPCCIHTPDRNLYTRTWPASVPLPSLPRAPIATVKPSALKLTDQPDRSIADSPSKSAPNCVHVPDRNLYTLTWPAKLPFPLFH